MSILIGVKMQGDPESVEFLETISTITDGDQLKMRPFGLNLPDQHTWPSRRPLARYEEMTDLPIADVLSSGDTWIDIGPGSNAHALGEMVGKGVFLMGITPHKMEIPLGVNMSAGFVPNNREFLDSHLVNSKLVTDIYAAFSYADDPIEVLVYETLLLKEGGLFRAVSEPERLGDAADHARIMAFAEKYLGVKLSFSQFLTWADARQEWEYELRVSGKRVKDPVSYDLNELMEIAKKEVGVAQKDRKLFEVEHKDEEGEPLGVIWSTKFHQIS